MLIFTEIQVAKLSLKIDQSDALVDKIKAKTTYQELKNNILENGITDPLLVRFLDNNLFEVETGLQRTLIARELNILKVKAFIYPFNNQNFASLLSYGKRINTVKEIQSIFKNENTPCLIDILGYIKDKTIKL